MKPRLIFVFACLVTESLQKADLVENGYTNLVVGISPDVPESQEIIDQIKFLMTEASRELFIASRNRAYFKQVKILLPKTWNMAFDQDLQGEFFEAAEIRVDKANPVYDDAPYTVRGSGCGEPGSFIHFTPDFLSNNSVPGYVGAYGNVGKVVTHEWAKMRWGVFEEHGYPGDDQFPLFFYKTIFTPSGERQVLTYNFCTNSKLFGYEQDMKTGGPCHYNEDNLPDENCMFYVNQQTSASASYMALPYLSSVQNFCDSTEDNIHDAELPTKQNLFCEGRSTWDVILDSPDFNGETNNPPDNSIGNTEPEFILVGSQLSSVNYVLVMDTSASMLPVYDPVTETWSADRAAAMLEAAKRWVKFEISDGVNLGVVTFADENKLVPLLNMTQINEQSRQMILDRVDDVYSMFKGQTCIGCGLLMASNYPTLLNNAPGGNVLLITDGQQKCNSPNEPDICISIAAATDVYVERKIRVVTIALGNEADPEIEDLAQRTGGKSFYVEDNGSTGTINDAFGGSTTSQPGDTLGNTDVDVYQRDWDFDADNIRDAFDVDMSIGRDLTFQLDVAREKSADECVKDITIKFQIPGDNGPVLQEETFKCGKTNFGVFQQDLTVYQNPVPKGRWVYQIEKDERVSISVKVTSKSADQSSDPILTKCWIATGSQEINSEQDLKLSVVADVRQGNKPVIGAKVKAIVERPPNANNEPQPEMELELVDNGSGADFIKNDGIYSRFFTHYTGRGRYNVKCQVAGDGDTQVNEGFINNRKKQGRAIPMTPGGSPMCCGSNTITDDSVLTDTGNFTRNAAGGAFQVNVDISGKDMIPPGKTTDLTTTVEDYEIVVNHSVNIVKVSFTSPGNNLDSPDKVARYIIKYAENITADNFDDIETEIDESYLVGENDLSPVDGGLPKEFNIKYGVFQENKLYYIAMKAVDEEGNESPLSNVVPVYVATRHILTDEEDGDSSASSAFVSLTILFVNFVISVLR